MIYVVCSILKKYINIITCLFVRTPKHDVPAFNATWIGSPRISHRPLGFQLGISGPNGLGK